MYCVLSFWTGMSLQAGTFGAGRSQSLMSCVAVRQKRAAQVNWCHLFYILPLNSLWKRRQRNSHDDTHKMLSITYSSLYADIAINLISTSAPLLLWQCCIFYMLIVCEMLSLTFQVYGPSQVMLVMNLDLSWSFSSSFRSRLLSCKRTY